MSAYSKGCISLRYKLFLNVFIPAEGNQRLWTWYYYIETISLPGTRPINTNPINLQK